MKVVNSPAIDITGLAKKVKIKLEKYERHTDFVVITMDDFDIILGMEFIMGQKSILVLVVEGLLIMGDNPNVMQEKM